MRTGKRRKSNEEETYFYTNKKTTPFLQKQSSHPLSEDTPKSLPSFPPSPLPEERGERKTKQAAQGISLKSFSLTCRGQKANGADCGRRNLTESGTQS